MSVLALARYSNVVSLPQCPFVDETFAGTRIEFGRKPPLTEGNARCHSLVMLERTDGEDFETL